jgi:hypothetical protein
MHLKWIWLSHILLHIHVDGPQRLRPTFSKLQRVTKIASLLARFKPGTFWCNAVVLNTHLMLDCDVERMVA